MSFQPQDAALWDADDTPEALRPPSALATARRFIREWAELRAVVQKELAGKLLQPPLGRLAAEAKSKGGRRASSAAAGGGSKRRFASMDTCAEVERANIYLI